MRRPRFMSLHIVLLITAIAGAATSFGAATAAAYRALKIKALDPSSYDPIHNVKWSGPPGSACRLLLIGDSRVAKWQLGYLSGWSVAKVGLAGATAGGFGGQAADLISSLRPTAVIVQIGINDATAGALQPALERAKTLERATLQLRGVADAARRAGSAAYIMTVPAAIGAPVWQQFWLEPQRGQFVKQLNARIRRLPHAIPVGVFDADLLLRDRHRDLDASYRDGPTHWNAKAYRRLNETMLEILHRSGRCSG